MAWTVEEVRMWSSDTMGRALPEREAEMLVQEDPDNMEKAIEDAVVDLLAEEWLDYSVDRRQRGNSGV